MSNSLLQKLLQMNRLNSMSCSLSMLRADIQRYVQDHPGDELEIHGLGAIETLAEIIDRTLREVRDK